VIIVVVLAVVVGVLEMLPVSCWYLATRSMQAFARVSILPPQCQLAKSFGSAPLPL